MLVLSSNYLPSILFFKLIKNTKQEIVIDLYENYVKQSYRNRANILSANGIQNLIIPIKSVTSFDSRRALIYSKIDYSQDWQLNHWRSLESAYSRSPYFEFYESDFKQLILTNPPPVFLWKFNHRLFIWLLETIGMVIKYRYSNKYIQILDSEDKDFRGITKSTQTDFKFKEYLQVFREKQQYFIANLSIIDLLFNEGPNTINFL